MPEFLNHCEKVAEDYATNQLREYGKKVYALPSTEGWTRDEALDLVERANEWIDYCAGDDDELYLEYSFKVFEHEGQLYIAQGHELDVDRRI